MRSYVWAAKATSRRHERLPRGARAGASGERCRDRSAVPAVLRVTGGIRLYLEGAS